MELTKLPKKYAFIDNLPGTKMVKEFRKIYGIKEIKGPKHNPIILSWASEVGLERIYKHDETAWCGLEMAVVVKRARGEHEIPKDPLWALNWLKFGISVPEPEYGDIVVFERRNAKGKLIGGHVGIYIGEDKSYYHIAGGNQGDASDIVRILKSRAVGFRRPKYINQPKEVKKYFLAANGPVTVNEA